MFYESKMICGGCNCLFTLWIESENPTDEAEKYTRSAPPDAVCPICGTVNTCNSIKLFPEIKS